MTASLQKVGRGRDFFIVNTMKYLRTLRNNIYHSNKRGTPIFFHLDTNPVLGHVLIHSVDKTHVLVVTVELICLLLLNILSFKFVPTPNKQISTPCCCSNQTHKLHCFSLDGRRCAIQSNPVPFFSQMFVTTDSAFV